MNNETFNKLYQEKQIDELKQYYLQKYNKKDIENKINNLEKDLFFQNILIDTHKKNYHEGDYIYNYVKRLKDCNDKIDNIKKEIAFYEDLLELKNEE